MLQTCTETSHLVRFNILQEQVYLGIVIRRPIQPNCSIRQTCWTTPNWNPAEERTVIEKSRTGERSITVRLLTRTFPLWGSMVSLLITRVIGTESPLRQQNPAFPLTFELWANSDFRLSRYFSSPNFQRIIGFSAIRIPAFTVLPFSPL